MKTIEIPSTLLNHVVGGAEKAGPMTGLSPIISSLSPIIAGLSPIMMGDQATIARFLPPRR
jgi:hypothetical protein